MELTREIEVYEWNYIFRFSGPVPLTNLDVVTYTERILLLLQKHALDNREKQQLYFWFNNVSLAEFHWVMDSAKNIAP